MRSSSGEHFIGLDHVRALAAFLVFTWHFKHAATVPDGYSPWIFPLALLDEGHTGVALFMTLSGYLFAKLLDGKRINYRAFLWNRVLRLVPLLGVVILIVGIGKYLDGESVAAYSVNIARGVIFPSLPNGGWSITVEFHYYLILPLFLWMLRRSRWLPVSMIVGALLLRTGLYAYRGEVQKYAYNTIIGRIDQFSLGMLLFHFRTTFTRRHFRAICSVLAFCGFFWLFDRMGGFYNNPSYPSTSPIWIILPTLEGLSYGIAIAWYDTSFSLTNSGLSWFVGRLGAYSYSIYLLQFFFFARAANFINHRIVNISTFYPTCLASLFCFCAMLPIGHLSFRFIEYPFLRFRRRYTLGPAVQNAVPIS